MDFICEEKPSSSPFIERIWHSHNLYNTPFVSMASIHSEMVISRQGKTISVTIRGPETRATTAIAPADTEFLGITFKVGVVIPLLLPNLIKDRQDVTLPNASDSSFWLNGRAWEFPTYENVDSFVEHMVREGLLVIDPLVTAVLQQHPVHHSLRTVQRRFLQMTGMSQNTLYQIMRALRATHLLKQHVSILDITHQLGYADQPHLTRSLKNLIGLSPGSIQDTNRSIPMSFLFKTSSIERVYDPDMIYTPGEEAATDEDRRLRIHLARRDYGSAGEMALPLPQRGHGGSYSNHHSEF
jgi:AraC-like DNA-binding protein